MLGGEAPRWQIKDRIRRKRPGSEQAQLDTPIPPVCPESHSSRSSSSLEHSADETMSSVVCGERDRVHTNAEETAFTAAQPFHPRISPLTHTALPVLQLHISTRSVTFYSVYHSLLYVLPTSADNYFLHPPTPCLLLFIFLLFSTIGGSDKPHRSIQSRLLICVDRGRDAHGYTCTSREPSTPWCSDLFTPP